MATDSPSLTWKRFLVNDWLFSFQDSRCQGDAPGRWSVWNRERRCAPNRISFDLARGREIESTALGIRLLCE
jgi:hypothetical protein